jgi:hypothetical protein
MSLTAFQQRRCLRILDALQGMRISTMFSHAIDPERDNVPTYLQIIHRPMDLGTVRQRLQSGQYQSIQQWKDDVELIWDNSYHFNGRLSLVSTLAKQLQQMFRDLTEHLTDDPAGDWVLQCDVLKHEVDRLSKMAPRPAIPPKSGVKVMATRQEVKRDALPTRTQSAPMRRLSEAEIAQLAEEVNHLEDPDHVTKIIELIKRHEPQLATSGEELEIEVSKLRNSTLLALRDLVSKFG